MALTWDWSAFSLFLSAGIIHISCKPTWVMGMIHSPSRFCCISSVSSDQPPSWVQWPTSFWGLCTLSALCSWWILGGGEHVSFPCETMCHNEPVQIWCGCWFGPCLLTSQRGDCSLHRASATCSLWCSSEPWASVLSHSPYNNRHTSLKVRKLHIRVRTLQFEHVDLEVFSLRSE